MLSLPVCGRAAEPADSIGAHLGRGDNYAQNGAAFQAIEEYRLAIGLGCREPEVYRSLASLLYHTGFIDDGIAVMQQAVRLYPALEFLHVELGILYFALNDLEKARKEFLTALALNSGLADSYYYLAEIFFKKKEDQMAWLFAKMSQRLGLNRQDIFRKLQARTEDPGLDPVGLAGDAIYLRQILVDTYAKANELVERIANGELFEVLASYETKEPNAAAGGYAGQVNIDELHPNIAAALAEQEILGPPVIVETENGFHLIQRLMPFDFDLWTQQLLARGADNGQPAPRPASESLHPAALPAKPAGDQAAPLILPAAEATGLQTPAADEIFYVKVETANIRKGPGLDSAIVAQLPHNAPVVERSSLGEWLAVEIPGTTQQGWIHGTLLARQPVASAPGSADALEKLPPPAKTTAFSVHVGYFDQEKIARQLVEKLKAQGYPGFSYMKTTAAHTRYMVVAGRYDSYQEALTTSRRLTSQGYDNFIARAKWSLTLPAEQQDDL